MTLRIAVPLAVVIYLTGAVAPRADAEEVVAKHATVIRLQYVSPSWLMSQLGLVSTEDYTAGKAAVWRRTAASPTDADASHLLPDGIDIVVPFDRDKALILYGTSESITDLRKVVRALDVPQVRVRVKTEFYKMPLDKAVEMGVVQERDLPPIGLTVIGTDTADFAKSLRESKDTTLISAPIISTISDHKATLSAKQKVPYEVTLNRVTDDGRIAEEETTQVITIDAGLSVLPRVNDDGTISLFVEPKGAGHTVAHAVERLKSAHHRVQDGESMVAASRYGRDDALLLIVTPTVVK